MFIILNQDSKVQNDWLNANFPPSLRSHSIILTADNVLTREALKAMLTVRRNVNLTRSKDNTTWLDHCQKVPQFNMEKILTDGGPCMEFNILELFAKDGNISEEELSQIKPEEILEKVNNHNQQSQILHITRNFTKVLGGIKYDDRGRITSASSTTMTFYTNMNATEAILHPVPEVATSVTSRSAFDFEGALLQTLQDKEFYPEGLDSSAAVQFSFSAEETRAFKSGLPFIAAGFVVMSLYVLLMMGKFDIVEHRAWLLVPALTSVIFGVVFSVGVTSVIGLPFTDTHAVMALLLLAIGIDDAFVVVGVLDNLTRKEYSDTIEQTFGKVMKRAGVSISITSLTSIVSFAVCGITVIPGVSSFCLGCAIGLLAIYALTVSFFFATLVLKSKHVAETRDGCLFWIKRKKEAETKEESSGRVSMSSLFRSYSQILVKTPCMVLVIVVTLLILGVGVWKASEVDFRFHAPDLISDDSYLRSYYNKRDLYFPDEGSASHIFVAPLTAENFKKLDILVNRMKKEVNIISDVSQWTEAFVAFVHQAESREANGMSQNVTEDEDFQKNLSEFLCSPHGVFFRPLFTFGENSSLKCSQPGPKVLLAVTPFSHPVLKDSKGQKSALHKTRAMVEEAQMSGHSFVHSEQYFHWESSESVEHEFPIELSAGLGSIFFLCLCSLRNIRAAVVVIFSVLCSLVNTIGFGYLWGLSLDLYTAVLYIVSTGLYVDYSVHVAYAFLQAEGTRHQRVEAALVEVGPAVFNGGLSTFLAISVTAFSGDVLWRRLFKTLTMSTFFGLFHGLAMLPAILSFWSSEKLEAKRKVAAGHTNEACVEKEESTKVSAL